MHNHSDSRLVVALDADGAARISDERVVIPAGESTRVSVSLRADRPDVYAEVAGWVTARPSRGPEIQVPYLLVARPLIVQASPDPSDGHSTVYVEAPTALAAAPVISVGPPTGRPFTVRPEHVVGNWYRAGLTVPEAGVYRLDVEGTAVTGQALVGGTTFEVTPASVRDDKWEPVGPYSTGGELTPSSSAPDTAVMAQPGKAGLWLTTDGGASWTQRNRLPVADTNGFGSVVIDAQRAERWWYAVNDTSTGVARILRTDDLGKTWTRSTYPDTSSRR